MKLLKRVQFTVSGCVQGVGFRPFIYRLAHSYHLSGMIRNTNAGVFIDVQGEAGAISFFQHAIISEKPDGAVIAEVHANEMPLHEVKDFKIVVSDHTDSAELPLLPDTAICHACMQELFDQRNRRYLYPFVHCVACGPRFSLFQRMPFDRANTSMEDFEMCCECHREYEDPNDRRFFSQTNCCPACGPKIRLVDCNNVLIAQENNAVPVLIDYLRKGKIISIKNTGGHQLLVDAFNEEAVKRLRMRKKRVGKPFALLFSSIDEISEFCIVPNSAEKVLISSAAPIVLLKKKGRETAIAHSVASESPYFGVMLAHNAIQHMMLKGFGRPLIATSGNLSDGPLCIDNDEALAKLTHVADAFLLHNRNIIHPLDDSVVHMIGDRPTLLRRARGYIPYSIPIPHQIEQPSQNFISVGSQLKNTFAFVKGKQIYVSQHIGNLESASTCRSYEQSIEKWERLLTLVPSCGVGDKHPNYYSTEYLQRRQMTTKRIQHHRAHVWSGMTDNQLNSPLLSVVWDGTGFGDDATIWGGEFFLVDDHGMRRFASLYPFKLPGGDKSIREPRYSALGLLYTLSDNQISLEYKKWFDSVFDFDEYNLLSQSLSKGINSPQCHSMGRLFDGVSALVGCCLKNQFEGHAAAVLEAQAMKCEKNQRLHYSIPLLKNDEMWFMDWRGLIQEIFTHARQGIKVDQIAFAFHSALADSIIQIAQIAGQKKVLLSGGVMQNKLLVEETIGKLLASGFEAYWHHDIPPNDGGLSVGQMMAALHLHK